MNVKCKVFRNSNTLVDALQKKGYIPTAHRNSVIFSLISNRGKFQVPLKKGYKLFLETKEMQYSGKAFVVCDVEGNPIKACYRPRHFFDENAYFQAEELCTVKAYQNSSMVAISHHKIVEKNGFAQIISTIIWSGKPEFSGGKFSLPLELKKFSKAVRAAKEKVGCRNCSCSHYI